MAVSQNVLGMNARNYLYIGRYNTPLGIKVADNKLLTKRLLAENNLPTAKLLHLFDSSNSVRNFDWSSLPDAGFVIKPARGYAGAGIISIKRFHGESFVTVFNKRLKRNDLETHILDILDGAHSLQNVSDSAIIEERIKLHPFFRKLVQIGIPDIRIIVFNRVPIMGMLRLPTKDSRGKANVHLGAVGVGVDMRTGITIGGVQRGEVVSKMPDTGHKIRGIRIPNWNDILALSSDVQGMSDMGYVGVDVVLDEEKGPIVLEINARPGLAIQIANMASLRTRLERIEHMNVNSSTRAIELARSLFAEEFSEKVQIRPTVIDRIENIILTYGDGEERALAVKIDTGADHSSIDHRLVKELNLPYSDKVISIRSSHGQTQRPTVRIKYRLRNKEIKSLATVIDRSHLTYPMIIGHSDLKGFLVDPSRPSIKS
ncbi:MAG: sugar-transfer associated ATP-grasp domain-containing protein [bacterium]|nr:sugar-transfer associated ATP-grasp domain-containing protein [bacterium]